MNLQRVRVGDLRVGDIIIASQDGDNIGPDEPFHKWSASNLGKKEGWKLTEFEKGARECMLGIEHTRSGETTKYYYNPEVLCEIVSREPEFNELGEVCY